jgi:hypothetical protein
MAHYKIGDTLYDMDPTTWPPADLKAIKAELGVGIAKFFPLLEEMDPDAIQTMLWIFRRRAEPNLARNDVEFTLREFIQNTTNTDEDVQETYPTLDFAQRDVFRDSLPAEQRERLFEPDGRLKQIGVNAPLVQTISETPTG